MSLKIDDALDNLEELEIKVRNLREELVSIEENIISIYLILTKEQDLKPSKFSSRDFRQGKGISPRISTMWEKNET